MEDKIIKCLAFDGKVSIICAKTTNLVEKARITHDLSPLATASFGRLLTITSIMASEMKGESHKLTIQVKGNGEIGKMLTTANNFPQVKGYVENPYVDKPLNDIGKLDVSGAVGTEGYINVIKDIGLKDPYVGISPIISGELGDDFANYFVNSEQRQSAVALGVLVDKNGVKSAGGYLINPMPDATEEDILSLEKNIFEAGAISKMLDKQLSLIEIVKLITGDKNVKILDENIIPIYKCDCSKDKIEKSLLTIGKEDLMKIKEEDRKAEIICHFCNTKHEFSEEELQNIIDKI